MLAWVLCAIGIGAGALGCVLLGSTARPVSRERSTRPARGRHAATEWREGVAAEAGDALTVVRRLAAGISPTEVTEVQIALYDVADQLTARRETIPARTLDESALAAMLDLAAQGARAEAAALSGVNLMRNDRRAFLNALRALRAVDPSTRQPTAGARDVSAHREVEVAPSFTVA